MMFLGDFAANASLQIWWNTNAIAGESITRSTDGSIRIYKDNSDTQRTSSSGITDSEDVDGLVGVQRLHIDLSDNADAGFYAAGSNYAVVLVAATIDGKTVNHALAQFSIANRPVQSLAAGVITAASIAAGAITAAKFAANALDAAALATDAVTEIAAAVLDRLTSAVTVAGSFGKYIVDKLALLGSSAATVATPQVTPGHIELYAGDTYSSATANHILTFTSNSVWPATAPTTLKLYIRHRDETTNLLSPDGTFVDAADDYVTVPLTAAQTATLTDPGVKAYTYQLVATYADASVRTLDEGTLTANPKNWS